MDLQIEKCIIADRRLPAPMVAQLLSYGHSLTFVLLDLQLLEEKLGQGTAAVSYLSGKDLVQLGKFTSPKRKREWLGGRIAAKLATAKLLEQVESEDKDVYWSGHIIMVDKNGRPFLAANKGNPANSVDISISHSGSVAAAMAVDKGFCGIDIQEVSPQVIKVNERFCTDKEKKVLQTFFPVEPDKQANFWIRCPAFWSWNLLKLLKKKHTRKQISGSLFSNGTNLPVQLMKYAALQLPILRTMPWLSRSGILPWTERSSFEAILTR